MSIRPPSRAPSRAPRSRATALSSPVTLAGNTVYYLVSQETAGGDTWYDYDSRVTTTAVATVSRAVWSVDGAAWHPSGGAGHGYVPLSFRYSAP